MLLEDKLVRESIMLPEDSGPGGTGSGSLLQVRGNIGAQAAYAHMQHILSAACGLEDDFVRLASGLLHHAGVPQLKLDSA